MRNKKLVNKYITDSKRPFSIQNIDFLYGGVIVLESYTHQRQKVYIDKNKNTLHFEYPTNTLNEIDDEFTKSHIFECVERYKQQKEREVEEVVNLIYNLSNPKK